MKASDKNNRKGSGISATLMMITTIALLSIITTGKLMAQVPSGFNYQAIATDNQGEPVASSVIQVRFTLLSDTLTQQIVWCELHPSVMTSPSGLISLVMGSGQREPSSAVAQFTDIDWSEPAMFLQTEIFHNTQWHNMGTSRLWSVPYAMAAGELSGAVRRLQVAGVEESSDEALFEVRNKAGDIVFAVYNEGVRVNVGDGDSKISKGGFAVGSFDRNKNDIQDLLVVTRDSVRVYLDESESKISKGGFAVGSFDRNKGLSNEFLRVTRDSVRIYLDDSDSKISKGGFAVGSFDRNKGLSQSFLNVSRDSVRIYIDDSDSKISKGGFAVGSFDRNKSSGNNFFDISPGGAPIIDPGEERILWYPMKNAFLAGRVLVEDPADVGENSMAMGYETKASGNYSQAFGYQSEALGTYSTAIGNRAIAESINSFAFGEDAHAINVESYAIGRGAIAEGFRSFAFGSAGIDSAGVETDVTKALGDYSFALGQGSVAEGLGSISMGLANSTTGNYSLAFGYKSEASGIAAIALGYEAVASFDFATSLGIRTVASGSGSTAIGLGTKASGDASAALGSGSESEGHSSFATGLSSHAIGNYSTAMGDHAISKGHNSTSIGTHANSSGDYSTAFGLATGARGRYSTAMGVNTVALSGFETAIGRFNTIYTPADSTGWSASDRLFVIGNGTSESNRSDAFTVFKNGNIRTQGSIISEALNGFRIRGESYGTIMRSSTSSFWILATDEGNPDGGFNSLRPFRVELNTGDVRIGNNTLNVEHGGNVGIGTTNPTDKLHVNGTARIGNSLYESGKIELNYHGIGPRNAYIDFHGDDVYTDYGLRIIRTSGTTGGRSQIIHRGMSDMEFRATDGALMRFYHGTTRKLEIGHGITASSDLNVTGSIQTNGLTSNGSLVVSGSGSASTAIIGSRIEVFGASPRIELWPIEGINTWPKRITATENHIHFQTVSPLNTLMSLSKDGYVGIGTTNPTRPLHVRADINGPTSYAAYISNVSTEDGRGAYIESLGGVGLRVASVVQGTYSVWATNSAVGGHGVFGHATNSNPGIGVAGRSTYRAIYANGPAGGTSSWNNWSDARLKDDVHTIPDALEKVLQMRGISFVWNANQEYNDRTKRYIGFLAQEVENIMPEVVSYDEREDVFEMSYAPITALLVEAMKEQQQIIDNQQKQITTTVEENNRLTTEIQQLNERLAAIEAMLLNNNIDN